MSKQNFCLLKASRSNVLFMLSCALIILFGFAVILPTVPANTFAEGDTPSEGIAITVSDSVSANVVLFDEGDYKIAKDTVSVSSSAAYGYELFLTTDSEAHQSIYLNDDPTSESRIAPVSGTIAEPATLTNNTWGFAIAGQGNFDDSYDPTNPDPASRFAIIPTADNQQAVFENNAATAEDNVDFYYGVKVEPTLEPGEYKTSAEYTAIAKEPPLTAKAILGYHADTGYRNLNFVYNRTTYNEGDTYMDNMGEARIVKVSSVPSNAPYVYPWGCVFEFANFDASFYDYRPTSTSWWFSGAEKEEGAGPLISISNAQNLNTSNVTDMSYMFDGAGSVTESDAGVTIDGIKSWDTGKVTNMSHMFSGFGPKRLSSGQARADMQSLDLSGWDTSSVTNVNGMFTQFSEGAKTISLNLSDWDLSNAAIYENMFVIAPPLEGQSLYLNLSGWTVPNNATSNMLIGLASPNQYLNLSGWDLKNVSSTSSWFSLTRAKNVLDMNLSNWKNMSAVTDMSAMFQNAANEAVMWNLNLDGWDVSGVTNMQFMFMNAGKNATNWNVSNLESWDT